MTFLDAIRPSWRRKVGMPFIERGLGSSPQRSLWIGGALTVLLLGLNVAYFYWLSGEPSWNLSYDDQIFLRHGFHAVFGALDLQLMGVLSLALLLIVPTLACQTVVKEAETRTLDAITIAPLDPLSIHNGFVFGSIAKLAPFLVGPLLLHVAIGFTPYVSFSTMVWSTSLLLLGSWALTSLGVMVGVLLKEHVRGPLGGLVLFVVLGAAMVLPMLALGESNDEHLAMLSAPAAIMHSYLVDSNAWLRQIEVGPEVSYNGFLFGIPFYVPMWSAVITAFFGLISTHVGRRKFADTIAPPVEWWAAMASMGLVSFVSTAIVGKIVGVRHVWDSYAPTYQQGLHYDIYAEQIGGDFVMLACVSFALAMPIAVILLMGTGASKAALGRYTVGRATGRAAAAPVSAARLIAIGAIPLVAGALAGFALVGMPSPLVEGARYGDRLFAVVPMIWNIAIVFSIVGLWRFSSQKGWQTLLAWITATGAGIVALIYMACIGDNNNGNLSMSDMSWSSDDSSVGLASLVLLSLLALPVVLGLLYRNSKRRFVEQVLRTVEGCTVEVEPASVGGAWPRASEPGEHIEVPLVDRHREDEGDVVTFGETRIPSIAQPWLVLEGARLELRPSRGDTRSAPVHIDLERAFVVNATREPAESDAEHNGVTLNLTITQSLRPGSAVQIGFAFVVESETVNANTPIQVQRLPLLHARDVVEVLAALRFYSELGGGAVPAVFG